MARFAEDTKVTPEKSRAEIEATLSRYGATAFMFGTTQERAVIMFECRGRRVRFEIALPRPDDPEFIKTPNRGIVRSPQQRQQACEQAIRQRWRALALVIKAKLEAVETGITEFEEEFLAHIVLPNGQTVGRWMLPQVAEAYERGTMPPLLPSPNDA